MDPREKAVLHRNEAVRLRDAWGVDAVQVRYSDDGHWYATLSRFPAALFDVHGYVRFASEDDYRRCAYIRIGKQISVPKPGISSIPGYVRVIIPEKTPGRDVDIHSPAGTEGNRRLVQHLERERNQRLIQRKKRHARSLDCEICGFSFARTYGSDAAEYCEVHHLTPLSQLEKATRTRLEELVILCANCHRVVHLQNPPYSLDQVRRMITSMSGVHQSLTPTS